ncbi:MAG: MFS transporter [Acidimicrobiia bacterium]
MVTRDPRTYELNPFGRLAVTHAAASVGDACVTVSLAGSIFFTQSIGESRTQVLLYLVLTLAPFSIVAPVIGPALDRSKAGRRTLMAVGCFGRAVVCFLMISQIDSVLLFPLAFVALVLSKGHAVAKASLVPAVVKDESELVEANSRLSLIAVVASVVGGLPAAGVVAVFDARGSLFLASVVFVLAGVLAMRIPAASHAAVSETVEERAELAIPSIRFAGSAMAVMRGCVGFLTFLLAFLLKARGESPVVFGLVLVASALGGFIGVIVTPRLRRSLREESILAGALLVSGLVALLAARDGGTLGAMAIGFTVAAGAAAGRIAFDSLVHRDGPEHLRGRAFARFETRFQLAWVAGALVPVVLLDVLSRRWGFFVLALVLFFTGLSYVGGLRARHEWSPPASQPARPRRRHLRAPRRALPPPAPGPSADSGSAADEPD